MPRLLCSAVLLALVASACDGVANKKLIEQHVELVARVTQLEVRVKLLESQVRAIEELGKRAAEAAPAVPPTVTVDLMPDAVRLGAQAVTVAELETRLRERRAAEPGLVLSVAATADVAHARVVEVFDAARHAGIEKVGLTTPGGGEGK